MPLSSVACGPHPDAPSSVAPARITIRRAFRAGVQSRVFSRASAAASESTIGKAAHMPACYSLGVAIFGGTAGRMPRSSQQHPAFQAMPETKRSTPPLSAGWFARGAGKGSEGFEYLDEGDVGLGGGAGFGSGEGSALMHCTVLCLPCSLCSVAMALVLSSGCSDKLGFLYMEI